MIEVDVLLHDDGGTGQPIGGMDLLDEVARRSPREGNASERADAAG